MAKVFILYWTREDGQGDIHMGEFESQAAAEAGIPAALELLLDQCGEEKNVQEIRNGRWTVDEIEDSD